MDTVKQKVHFVDSYLLAPTNPVLITLIGAGGTGSQVLTALGRTHASLVVLGHPGLHVTLIDPDTVSAANTGRQLFSRSEIGLHKSVALINRVNRFFGTDWKGSTVKVHSKTDKSEIAANLIISCVDSIKTRFDIASLIGKLSTNNHYRNKAMYWLDYGNGKHTGQCILSTIGKIKQPTSEKYEPVASLPAITNEYRKQLSAQTEDNQPSCSMAEALHKQDLFINTSLSALGSSLLWSMFREGMIHYRGFFMNVKDLRSQPIQIN